MAVEKTKGYIYHESQNKAFSNEIFNDFLEVLCEVISTYHFNEVVLVYDNAPIHRQQNVADIYEQYDFEYLFNPPYSPMFNVIEEEINDIKTQLAITRKHEILAIAAAPRGQKIQK